MLSTSQVFQEWSNVLKLLSEIKAHAAAHPDQPSSSIKERLAISMAALLQQLASPAITWKQLLKKKVRTACDLNSWSLFFVLSYLHLLSTTNQHFELLHFTHQAA